MLELNKGIDILSEIGGVKTIGEAKALFEKTCDPATCDKLYRITNEGALLKIANAIALTGPDAVFVNTGSADDVQQVREMSLAKGEEKPLAMRDHTVHYDLSEEQGRIVDRTFYIVNDGEETSVLASRRSFLPVRSSNSLAIRSSSLISSTLSTISVRRASP